MSPLTHPVFKGGNDYRDAMLSTRPLRYYRCNESSGSVLRDLMGVQDATVFGTPTKMGAAAPPGITDGAGFQTTNLSGGYATAGAANLPATSYSLAAWTYGGTVADRGIFGNWSNAGATNGGGIYRNAANRLGVLHSATINIIASVTSDNGWHMVVSTWDGSFVRMYIDGVLVGGPTADVSSPAGTHWGIATYFTGADYLSRITTGITAECAVWDRALSVNEIRRLTAVGFGR